MAGAVARKEEEEEAAVVVVVAVLSHPRVATEGVEGRTASSSGAQSLAGGAASQVPPMITLLLKMMMKEKFPAKQRVMFDWYLAIAALQVRLQYYAANHHSSGQDQTIHPKAFLGFFRSGGPFHKSTGGGHCRGNRSAGRCAGLWV